MTTPAWFKHALETTQVACNSSVSVLSRPQEVTASHWIYNGIAAAKLCVLHPDNTMLPNNKKAVPVCLN
jgi:hypothetical protein